MESGASHALEQATSVKPSKCYHCGSRQHKARNYPHEDKQRNLCKKSGYLARVAQPVRQSGAIYQQTNTHQVEEATEEDEENDDKHFVVHKVADSKRYRKLVAWLIVGETVLEFEVNTRAELSTIPAVLSLYHKILEHIPLHHSSLVLHLYDGSVLPTKVVITVTLKQGS